MLEHNAQTKLRFEKVVPVLCQNWYTRETRVYNAKFKRNIVCVLTHKHHIHSRTKSHGTHGAGLKPSGAINSRDLVCAHIEFARRQKSVYASTLMWRCISHKVV